MPSSETANPSMPDTTQLPALARLPASHAKRHAEARARPGHERVAGARGLRYRVLRTRRSLRSARATCFLFTMSNSPVSSVPARLASGFFFLLFALVAADPPSEGIGGAPRDVQPCTC